MSGVDEQSRDIPICPVCGKRPRYWSLYPTVDGDTKYGSLWFFSDEYLKTSKFGKLTSNGFSDLCAVKSIRCRPNEVLYVGEKRHLFTEDSEIFGLIVRMTRVLNK